MTNKPYISVVLPCLNEELAITSCLDEIKRTELEYKLNLEIIVVNNNSTDNTADIVINYAKSAANLFFVNEDRNGYGFAYLRGLSATNGKYIFMADADGTYNFAQIPEFIKKLEEGNDLVVGNRFAKKIASKSMPWLHKYVGNPVLSGLVRLLFGIKIHDIHCGARAISGQALKRLNLYTGGMEFASEMIIAANKEKLKIAEIPVDYRDRLGKSKLNSWVDGWRHLRFILLYSPLVLFFFPGLIFFLLGAFFMFLFYLYQPAFFGIQFYNYPMFLFSLMIILGYQLIQFSLFSKIYAINHLGDKNKYIESVFNKITIEKTIIIGLAIALVGGVIYISIFKEWVNSGFGSLMAFKKSVVGLTLIFLGMQTFFSSFIFSILGIKKL
ncbi:MAG: glycosyltransferase family 2 protein [Patescibacteria group bacterium]